MKLLLDTSIFLWYISGDKKLKPKQRSLIRDPKNDVYVSVISIWEASVKQLNGKLDLPEYAGTYLPRMRELHRFLPLDFSESSLIHLQHLPLYHHDPFDRMLICQALQEHLTLVTSDKLIKRYPVKIV